MDQERAQKLIVLATFITLASTTGALLKKPKKIEEEVKKKQKKELKAHRIIVGGFMAMLFCSLIAEVSPQIGVGIASLVTAGAFGEYGLPTILSYYEEGQGGKEKTATESTPKVELV
jgi:hypothetical protein